MKKNVIFLAYVFIFLSSAIAMEDHTSEDQKASRAVLPHTIETLEQEIFMKDYTSEDQEASRLANLHTLKQLEQEKQSVSNTLNGIKSRLESLSNDAQYEVFGFTLHQGSDGEFRKLVAREFELKKRASIIDKAIQKKMIKKD